MEHYKHMNRSHRVQEMLSFCVSGSGNGITSTQKDRNF